MTWLSLGSLLHKTQRRSDRTFPQMAGGGPLFTSEMGSCEDGISRLVAQLCGKQFKSRSATDNARDFARINAESKLDKDDKALAWTL